MKAVLSDKIYLSVTPEVKATIKEALTFKLTRTGRGGKRIPYTLVKCIEIREEIIAIPIGREDLIPEGYEVVDKRVTAETKFPEFKLELREDQEEIVTQVNGSAIINAQPSWGKTFCGIAIASRLKRKTLVVVHTLFLLEQWISEVKKTLGIEPGIISSSTYNIDSPITITNTQTYKKYADKLKKEFGTLILDEAHHSPASTFTDILEKSHAKVRIGLSATLNRKDGLGVLLPGYFSTTILKPAQANHMKPRVLYYDTGVEFSDDNSIPWALRLNDLYNEVDYQNIVLELAHAFSSVHKYPTLVVSNRIEFLEHLYEILQEDAILVTGATKNRQELIDKVHNGEKSLIFGSTSIFAEGTNIPILSCLIAAQPINNDTLIEQLAGRVSRVHPNKKEPIVIDLRLQGRTGGKQAMSRLNTYARLGYRVDKLPNINDNSV